jgi:hypothetical protein
VLRDFAPAWYKANQPQPGSTDRIIALDDLGTRLPVFTRGTKPDKIMATDVTLFTDGAFAAADLVLSGGGTDTAFADGPQSAGTLKCFVCQPDVALTSWQLKLGARTTPANRVWLVIRYTLGNAA